MADLPKLNVVIANNFGEAPDSSRAVLTVSHAANKSALMLLRRASSAASASDSGSGLTDTLKHSISRTLWARRRSAVSAICTGV